MKLILKNKNEECIKITSNKIVGNITIINDLISYTKNLEFHYNNNIEYIRQLHKENEEICSVFKFVVSCLIIIILILPYIIIYR